MCLQFGANHNNETFGMKAFLLALDGLHTVFQWLAHLAAVGLVGFFWWTGDIAWRHAVLSVLGVVVALALVGIIYRLGTYPMRTEVIRSTIVEAWKDGVLTEEQRNEALRGWRSGAVWHLLLGLNPFHLQ